MKMAYKHTKRLMGVYGIKNSQNNEVLIGFSTDVPARFNRHKAELRFGNHQNRGLQKIWDSFGELAIEFEVLDTLEHDENVQASPNEELQVLAEMWRQKLEKEGCAIVYLKNG